MKIVGLLLLLGMCTGLLFRYPFLFELPLLLLIGGVYLLFFRKPSGKE